MVQLDWSVEELECFRHALVIGGFQTEASAWLALSRSCALALSRAGCTYSFFLSGHFVVSSVLSSFVRTLRDLRLIHMTSSWRPSIHHISTVGASGKATQEVAKKLTQNKRSTGQSEFLCQMHGIFTFLMRRAALEHHTHLIYFLAISSPRRKPSRDSGLLRGT